MFKVMTVSLLSLQNTGIQFHIKAKPVQWLADNRRGRTTLHLPPHVLVLPLAFISPSGYPWTAGFLSWLGLVFLP